MNTVLKKVCEALKKTPAAFKKMKKPAKIILCAVLVAAIGAGGGLYAAKKKKNAKKDSGAQTSVVMRGSVVSSITGSGTVEPIEQRDIVPQVNGKVTYAPFDEGDTVQEGDVLYTFESTSAQNTVEKAKTSVTNKSSDISKVKENISNLTVRANASGRVSDLNLSVGQEANGAICKITNYKNQTATVPFPSDEVYKIKKGDSVSVSVEKYMITTTGTVARKYSSTQTLSSGAVVCNVEIDISGETLEEGVKVTATAHTASGDVASASYGEVEYEMPVTLNAEQKGTVTSVNVKNGDWVNRGDVVATLKNSDLSEELRSANQGYSEAVMSLSDAESNLEKYMVTSPISGVVLSKDYSAGDTVSGQNSTTMMVVADLSKMKFTISVDELDIAKIEVGQTVDVTADALEGEKIVGTITSLSKLGTASNGVTTYPVEVTIDSPGSLMPGMNVSAEIIVEQADDVLYLPVSAVEYFGGKYYVTVVGEIENMPANTDKNVPADNTKKPESDRDEEKSGEGKTGGRKASVPEIKLSGKEERTEVTVGISNDDYYEIKSGVTQGQAVKNTTQASGSSGNNSTMPGGFGGGMPGGGGMGGVPGGGMGGGMPGGR